jgi:hypothetical protein
MACFVITREVTDEAWVNSKGVTLTDVAAGRVRERGVQWAVFARTTRRDVSEHGILDHMSARSEKVGSGWPLKVGTSTVGELADEGQTTALDRLWSKSCSTSTDCLWAIVKTIRQCPIGMN